MPTRTPICYANTCFYKIVCKDESVKSLYVGHTTNYFQRKAFHEECCDHRHGIKYKTLLYETMRAHGCWNGWGMILIETIRCEDLKDARMKERQHMEDLGADLNGNCPYKSKEERAVSMRAYTNKKYADKKEAGIKDESIVCPCGSTYTAHHKTRHMRTKKHEAYVSSCATEE